MRKVIPAAVLAVALVSGSGVAGAQSDAPQKKYKAQPLILEKEQLGTAAVANAGRKRMRSGDCAGALDAFDVVLRTAVDPTINRDRGLCHERLGHAYPAIDDYRVYLTAEPEAPDAEGIRQRLVALEQTTTGRSSASSDTPDSEQKASDDATKARAGMTAKAAARDKMDTIDRDDVAELTSPLRRGKGWAFAPFLAVHKWLDSDTSFGDSTTWSESVGLQLRYSFGKMGSFLLEAGFEHFNTTDVDLSTRSGLTSLLAYEFRFGLDPDYDNQLFLAPGIGYQHTVDVPTDPQFQTTSRGAIVPRVRFGYRHMIDANVAFDVALDFGVAKQFQYDSSQPDLPIQELLALGVGVAWGL